MYLNNFLVDNFWRLKMLKKEEFQLDHDIRDVPKKNKKTKASRVNVQECCRVKAIILPFN